MIILGDSAQVLKDFNDECIDLTVTSPPYDNLRTYSNDYDHHNNISKFDFKIIAKELYRVTKSGGILVWIINDSTQDRNESGTSFKQVLYFKDIGFKLNDTMIYTKTGITNPTKYTYYNIFEFMFILSKDNPKTFNPIRDRENIGFGRTVSGKTNRDHGRTVLKESRDYKIEQYGIRYNIWNYHNGYEGIDKEHPATFPEKLAQDHIKSWSNEGDLILDPFMGSGTTAKAAHQLNRKWVGIEINPNYVAIAKKRLEPYYNQSRLLPYLQNE